MAEIIVRRRRVIDDLNRTRLIATLEGVFKDDLVMQAEEWEWVSLVTATQTIDGYTLPNVLAPQETILASFNAYLELDSEFVSAWKDVYIAAQKPLNAPALVPPDMLTEDEKKSTRVREPKSA